jgi:hypothetical protein
MLGLLKDKGYVTHEQEGPRYVYSPTADLEQAQRTALKEVLGTFFNGSMEAAVAAMLEHGDAPSPGVGPPGAVDRGCPSRGRIVNLVFAGVLESELLPYLVLLVKATCPPRDQGRRRGSRTV